MHILYQKLSKCVRFAYNERIKIKLNTEENLDLNMNETKLDL